MDRFGWCWCFASHVHDDNDESAVVDVDDQEEEDSLAAELELVDEIPELPTVVFDLDETLIYSLRDPQEALEVKSLGFKVLELWDGTEVAQRPGLEQLFRSLAGYNLVLYSAGGSSYVSDIMSELAEQNPSLRGRFCKVLSKRDLVTYWESSGPGVLCKPSLKDDDVGFVKDLRRTRDDGDLRRIVLIDDNDQAFQVESSMPDDAFREEHDFTKNAVLVPGFDAVDTIDWVLSDVSSILQDIACEDDLPAALQKHPKVAQLRVAARQADFDLFACDGI